MISRLIKNMKLFDLIMEVRKDFVNQWRRPGPLLLWASIEFCGPLGNYLPLFFLPQGSSSSCSLDKTSISFSLWEKHTRALRRRDLESLAHAGETSQVYLCRTLQGPMVLRCHLTGGLWIPTAFVSKPTQWILSTLGERQWRKGHSAYFQILVSRAMLIKSKGSILEHLHELWRQSLSVRQRSGGGAWGQRRSDANQHFRRKHVFIIRNLACTSSYIHMFKCLKYEYEQSEK